MTADNGNPADSPKPAQCAEPGCYVWTPHTHYGPSVTLTQQVSAPEPDATNNQADAACPECLHQHTPTGCVGPRSPSDVWAGVYPDGCDCDAEVSS